MTQIRYSLTEDTFASTLLSILRAYPEGLSEYDFLTEVWQSGSTALPKAEDSDPLQLFRAHFLLFNALYRLRDKLWAAQSGTLEISPLHIMLHPYIQGQDGTAVAQSDALREYYLDEANLHKADSEEVEGMLERFWERFAANDELHDALAVLGLEAPVDFVTVKRRYRELTMKHHPDRGGSKEMIQQLNTALDVLQKIYT